MNIKMISRCKGEKFVYNHILNISPEEEDFELHTHDICELILLKKGDVSGVIDGKTYKLQKNSLIIFRPNVLHGIKINNSSEDYERFNFLFDEKMMANKIFAKVPADLDVINLKDNNYIIELFNKLDYYYEHFYDDNLKKLVNNVIEEIVFNLTLVSKEEKGGDLISVNPVINRAIEYIENNYTSDLTIDELSEELHISKSYLHQIFMKNLQISPKKYVNAKRLAKAQNLIRMGEKPYEVYLVCGFSDYATFYRNYVLHFGHTPSKETEIEIERKIKS